jgi:predicted nucleotidyltransferase
MIPLLQGKSAELAQLCRSYDVARLEVFGSAADDSFDPARSDVDFLVAFQPGVDLGPWLGRYFDLRDALSRLLCRSVDLVMISALRNPYFIREVNRTRQLLYAA